MKKTYDYSSTQFNLPLDVANKIIKWGKENIPEKILYIDPEKKTSYGRETEIHVTVLYGITSDSSLRTRALLKNQKSFEIKLGKISIFDTSDLFDVVKIEVMSPELHKLNQKFCNGLAYENKYSKYIPHVTIAYVKHGEGKKYNGLTPFQGIKINVDNVLFSPKSRTGKEKITFNESITSFGSFLYSIQ